jgi:chemotaxis protein methyltransferase CheR
MAQDAFPQLADYLRKRAGINLVENEKNRVLVQSRLHKVLPLFGVESHSEFLSILLKGDAKAHADFVNAMTTNTTHFWREQKHFEHFEMILPEIAKRAQKEGRKEIRIWCAASSSGEEPYTLAMIAQKLQSQLLGLSVQVLATDIDTQILSKAMNAVYALDGVAALPTDLRTKYFASGKGNSAHQVRVKSEIRKLVTFAQFNLITDPYTFKKPFDTIFCRNVMIYFTREDISKIVLQMQDVMYPGGMLYVGHSETLMGIPHDFKSPLPAVYQFQNSLMKRGKAA